MIDFARIDEISRGDGKKRHDRENHKDGAEAGEIADASRKRRRDDIAAVVESFVAPELVGKAGLTHEPSVTAAIAGPIAAPAIPETICAALTSAKSGLTRIASDATVMIIAVATTMVRLWRVRSTKAPAGVVTTIPACRQ
jgi:hypothetical protein